MQSIVRKSIQIILTQLNSTGHTLHKKLKEYKKKMNWKTYYFNYQSVLLKRISCLRGYVTNNKYHSFIQLAIFLYSSSVCHSILPYVTHVLERYNVTRHKLNNSSLSWHSAIQTSKGAFYIFSRVVLKCDHMDSFLPAPYITMITWAFSPYKPCSGLTFSHIYFLFSIQVNAEHSLIHNSGTASIRMLVAVETTDGYTVSNSTVWTRLHLWCCPKTFGIANSDRWRGSEKLVDTEHAADAVNKFFLYVKWMVCIEYHELVNWFGEHSTMSFACSCHFCLEYLTFRLDGFRSNSQHPVWQRNRAPVRIVLQSVVWVRALGTLPQIYRLY